MSGIGTIRREQKKPEARQTIKLLFIFKSVVYTLWRTRRRSKKYSMCEVLSRSRRWCRYIGSCSLSRRLARPLTPILPPSRGAFKSDTRSHIVWESVSLSLSFKTECSKKTWLYSFTPCSCRFHLLIASTRNTSRKCYWVADTPLLYLITTICSWWYACLVWCVSVFLLYYVCQQMQ